MIPSASNIEMQYLAAVTYCCKELHVTCNRVRGTPSDKGLSQINCSFPEERRVPH